MILSLANLLLNTPGQSFGEAVESTKASAASRRQQPFTVPQLRPGPVSGDSPDLRRYCRYLGQHAERGDVERRPFRRHLFEALVLGIVDGANRARALDDARWLVMLGGDRVAGTRDLVALRSQVKLVC
jgi:hypothetical protein